MSTRSVACHRDDAGNAVPGQRRDDSLVVVLVDCSAEAPRQRLIAPSGFGTKGVTFAVTILREPRMFE